MNTFQLECFKTVCDYLNFARAAEQMGISQPSMTYQIHTLEDELNTTLLQRTTRSVEITKEGYAFLDDANKILEIAHGSLMRFRQDEAKAKEITIGCAAYLNPFDMGTILSTFHDAYPKAHPRLCIAKAPALLDKVEKGDVDLALLSKVKEEKQNLTYKEIQKTDVMCIGMVPFWSDNTSMVTIHDFKDKPMIVCDPSVTSSAIADLQWQITREKKMNDLFLCDDMQSTLILAQAGIGYALVPDIYLYEDAPAFYSIKVDIEPASFGLYVKKKQYDSMIRDMIKIIQATLA